MISYVSLPLSLPPQQPPQLFQTNVHPCSSKTAMSSLSGFSDSEWPVSDSDTSSIEWLSEPEEEPVDDSTYIESSKKLRQTKARQQPRIPRRKNAFFDHFDPTIRSMIYAHLVFDPIKRLH